MNFLRIAWRDISSIFKNRFIRVSVVGIIIVPLLYSLLYLAAFWDPYSRLTSMPVAVVNLDEGSTKDSSPVNYGDDVVKNLKDNSELGWKFVSLKDAQDGVKGSKYYSMFVIPKDFSKNVLSAKDGKPQQPKILYKSNDGKNFLAAQIGGKVEVLLKAEISKTITKEYTQITFDNLYDVKDGFKQAADGSKQLSDGMVTAKDGSTQIMDGLGTLNGKVPELKDGVSKLYTGSTQIADGVNNGSQLLNQGISQLYQHQELMALLNPQNGKTLKSIMEDASSLTNVDTSAINSVTPLMNSSTLGLAAKTQSDFNSLSTVVPLSDLSKLMTPTNMANANKLLLDTATLSKVDMTKLAPFQSLLGYSPQLSGLMTQAGALAQMDMSPIQKISPLLNTTNATTLNNLLQGASTNLGGTNGQNTIDFVNGQISSAGTFINQQTKLNNAYTNVSAILNDSSKSDADKLAAVNSILPQYKALVDGTATNMNNSATQMSSMSNTLTQMKTLIDNNKTLIDGTQNALSTENIKAINSLLTQLGTAQSSLQDPNTVKAMQAVKTAMTPDNIAFIQTTLGQLTAMKSDLDSNATSLGAISNALNTFNNNDGMTKVQALQQDINAAKPMLSALQTTLSKPETQAQLANAPQLISQLTGVQQKLKDNQKLLDVAKDALADGNIEMANNLLAQVPTVSAKVNQLTDGVNQLTGGLKTLNSNVPALADGVSKLYTGSKDLNDGMTKLNDGSKELSDKLADGSDKINKNLVNSSSDMATFVSEPLKMSEQPINPVKNYGTGFTPYFIPLSLWVGAIMMFFVITDKVDNSLNASSASVVAGKFLSYGYIGIMQAVLVSTVVLCLGLKPQNYIAYYLFNILMSYVFIAIIQCLIFLLGDPGRLIAIAILILQLTSCAGTFPLEVVPKFFKVLNPYMPFTYCVSALREIISGGNYAVVWKDVAILACVMFVFLFISMVMKGHADKMQELIEKKKEEEAANIA